MSNTKLHQKTREKEKLFYSRQNYKILSQTILNVVEDRKQ